MSDIKLTDEQKKELEEEAKAVVLQMSKEENLWALCKKFIEDEKISCAESVYQTDSVIINAYELIEKICNIVGYHKYEDDENEED